MNLRCTYQNWMCRDMVVHFKYIPYHKPYIWNHFIEFPLAINYSNVFSSSSKLLFLLRLGELEKKENKNFIIRASASCFQNLSNIFFPLFLNVFFSPLKRSWKLYIKHINSMRQRYRFEWWQWWYCCFTAYTSELSFKL